MYQPRNYASSGDDRLELTGYITAFVDLLGLGLQLEKLDVMFSDDADGNSLMKDMQDSLGQILRLRREFETGFKRLQELATTPPVGSTTVESLDWQKLHSAELVVQYVSDAIILSVRVNNLNLRATYVGFRWMLQSIARATLVLLAKGQTCRGGIEIGSGCEISPGEIVGGALAAAHRLERYRAVSPRVVIGPRLLELLRPSNASELPKQPRDEILLAAACSSLLAQDEQDDEHFVDFLAPWSLSALQESHPPTSPTAVRQRLAALCLANRTNVDIARKYEWLERYARSRDFWVHSAH